MKYISMEDGAEGQQAAHERDHPGLQVPLLGRYGRRNALHAAGVGLAAHSNYAQPPVRKVGYKIER